LKKPILYICSIVCILGYVFFIPLPKHLKNVPNATVLVASSGELLGAKIASDEQWRFPYNKNVPDKFRTCLVNFEDRYFNYHPGFNPISIGRALYLNVSKGRIVSGGSTLTMQLARMSRNAKNRGFSDKIIELLIATKLELVYSKKSILAMYAAHAPMGGNTVGLEAASWRYFGRSAHQLSWAEAATLAVLPNSPGLIFPGKNQHKLLQKRNNLLDNLAKRGYLDSLECHLAKTEPLPDKPFPLPNTASHLLERAIKDGHEGMFIESTIRYDLQKKMNEIIRNHHNILKANEINNIAALVIETNSGHVIAYTGNIPDNKNIEGVDVDIIMALRSPGSLLKPVLYASMLEAAMVYPQSLVPDIPTNLQGYAPVNFNRSYDGAVPADKAISRSLNVPAVRMLKDFGIEKFNHILKKAGISSLDKPASHYGLSIILGGIEASLWDMCSMYAGMARSLNYYNENKEYYLNNPFKNPVYIANNSKTEKQSKHFQLFSAGTLWTVFNAMVEVSRPDEDRNWKQFSSSQKIAWKTGTSYGYRDGWSIGCTPQYIVGVWTGNANGEGRPGLVGLYTAAPIMLDIFKYLNPQTWFKPPFEDLEKIKICDYSGYKAGEYCESISLKTVPKSSLLGKTCPYHKLIHVDKTLNFRVNNDCEASENIITMSWFILPPVQENYFKQKNSFYKTPPPYRIDCLPDYSFKVMGFVYPEDNAIIHIPKEIDGGIGKTVIKVVHRNPKAQLYWHLNGKFLGRTQHFHHMPLDPETGHYIIEVVDDNGIKISRKFQIIRSER